MLLFTLSTLQFILVHIHLLVSSTSRRLQALNTWIVPNNTLPRADYGMAPVIYNNTIYLLGGVNFPNQSIEFDPKSNTFIDHGANALSADIHSHKSYGTYARLGPFLFMFYPATPPNSPYWSNLFRYNLATQETVYLREIMNDAPCLTAYNDMIFIVGGDDGSSAICATAVYDVNGTYLDYTSQMFCAWGHNGDSRYRSSASGCIVNPFDEALYQIAHLGVQKISTIDIFNQTWQKVGILPESMNVPRVVVYDDDIWIMNGNAVYVVDGTTNEITFFGNMSYYVYQPAVLLFNHTIYIFGGRNKGYGSNSVNSLQFYELPTFAPTLNPTISTKFPSLTPTEQSLFPSLQPTTGTIAPSWNPSKTPTYGPTSYSTIGPTLTPSDIYVPTLILPESTRYDNIAARDNNILLWIVTVLASVIFVLLLVALIIYMINKWKKKMVAQITQQVTAKVNAAAPVPDVNNNDVISNNNGDNVNDNDDSKDMKQTIEGNVDMLGDGERNRESLSNSSGSSTSDALVWSLQNVVTAKQTNTTEGCNVTTQTTTGGFGASDDV